MANRFAPIGLTMQPDGSIAADFSGHVHASGLDLDLLGPAVSARQRVSWLRPSDGWLGGAVEAFENPAGAGIAALAGFANTINDRATARLSARDENGVEVAFFQVTRGPGVDDRVTVGMPEAPEDYRRDLFTQHGESDWVQLPGDRESLPQEKIAVDWGVDTVPTTGLNSAVAAVPHRLGRAPVAVIATPRSAGVNAFPHTYGYAAPDFQLLLIHRDAGGVFANDVEAAWVAIG